MQAGSYRKGKGDVRLSIETADRPWISEDWLAVAIGLGVFALALLSLAGIDTIGWVVSTSVWTDLGSALAVGLALLVLFVLINHIAPLARS